MHGGYLELDGGEIKLCFHKVSVYNVPVTLIQSLCVFQCVKTTI